MLEGRHVLLGITGGIAAYKAAALASKLTQAGAQVKVVMTQHAKEFVTPLTFQALTRNRVYDDTFAEKDPEKVAHIDVADWADFILIAPATANIIGKAAGGLSDDMLSTVILAARCPVYIAPAMNVNMYEHPAVQENMKTLKQRGWHFIEPGDGYLACGWIGKGRMAEPEDITAFLQSTYQTASPFKGKKVLVTAGPTYEYSDPVRVFTNPSSGKMGFAAAAEAAALGAEVTLVTGPVQMETPPHVKRIDVTSAEEMYEAVMRYFPEADVVCKAAAVSDYRPAERHQEKMKKQTGPLSIEMERTKDILAALGEQKSHQLLIGFAAESTDVETYAKDKLERKNLDMVVANNISSDRAGFQTDTNEIMLLRRGESPFYLPLLTKTEAAKEIFAYATPLLKKDES
ncbi:bifunctional phosphopantothenoylcysteine decarboxylase/phosphopantothenate--cysteine ligase CoaBC [Salibacterium aidingense]|uniref:bifunctional phosphopantothenoylcysteine decarboxylase/phosphopantothenate--cysteine ligase CoaBC n=1 Tax=Salibacterium aidingense TaxID=384933 RepID=UPI003BCE747B